MLSVFTKACSVFKMKSVALMDYLHVQKIHYVAVYGGKSFTVYFNNIALLTIMI